MKMPNPFGLRIGEIIHGEKSQIRFVRIESYAGKGAYAALRDTPVLRFESVGTGATKGSTRSILLFPDVVAEMVSTVRQGVTTRSALKNALWEQFDGTYPALAGVDQDYINLALHLVNGPQNVDLPSDAPSGTALRRILVRQGQQAFRREVYIAYGGRCFITGGEIASLLDAAHIHPFSKSKSNKTANGLLLRTDIHTLFDIGLLNIKPSTPLGSVRVELAEGLLADSNYKKLHGKTVHLPKAIQVAALENLRLRNA